MDGQTDEENLTVPLLCRSDALDACERVVVEPERFGGGIVAAVVSCITSLPALLGTCCFPVLLAGIFGISASAASREFAHSVSFVANLVILSNLTQYAVWKSSARRGTHFVKYGPAYLMLGGSMLVMADLTRHVLKDAGIVSGLDMYKPGCDGGSFSCLSAAGWIFTVVCTYSGYVYIIASIAWTTGFLRKVANKMKGFECCFAFTVPIVAYTNI